MPKRRISDRAALLSVIAVVSALAVAPADTAIAKPGATEATVQFVAATYAQAENGTTALVGIRRDNTAEEAQVRLLVTGGTATDGADYSGFKKSVYKVVFAAGQALVTVPIPILNDTLFEGPETVNLALDGPLVSVTPGAVRDAVLTIVDDEYATVSVAGGPVVEEGGSIGFPLTVTTSAGTTARTVPVSVRWSLVFGTASAADVIGPTTGVVVIPTTATAATVSIATVDDVLDEADLELFDLVLSQPSPGAVVGAGGSAAGTIIDNDGWRCPNDDAFEDNDDADQATPLDWGATVAGILCPTDSDVNGRLSDFYRFDAFIGRTVDVLVQFLHREGDLNLRLLGPDGTVRSSREQADAERIAFQVPMGGAGRYVLQVYAAGDSGIVPGTSYTVTLAGLTCSAPDPYEDDDDAASARPLASGIPLDGVLCPDDSDVDGRTSDFFAFDAAAGQAVDVLVGFFDGEGDVNAVLWGPHGSVVAWSNGMVDNEHITWVVPAELAGRYALQVILREDDGVVIGNAYAVMLALG